MDPKEENVEYHIEIQNCEEGSNPDNGDVMFVLDLGEADIPENIAMQLAQLAADGSLNLSEGTNSIMVQNEAGASETHIMQVEKEPMVEREEAPQIIHLQMGDDSEYLTDAAGSMLPPGTEIGFQSDLVPIEKSIFGKTKSRGISSISLLDRSSKMDRTPKASISKSKSSTIHGAGDQMGQVGKANKTSAIVDSKEKKGKGDKLNVCPFLKGKTPVMLTVAEDGQVIPESTGSGDILVKSEVADPSSPDDHKNQPIILDYSTEKSKLDVLLASIESCKNQEGSSTEVDRQLGNDTIITPKPEELPESTELSKASVESQVTEEGFLDDKNSIPGTITENDVVESMATTIVDDPSLDAEMSQAVAGTQIQEAGLPVSLEELPPLLLPQRKCEHVNCEFETSNFLDLAQHLEDEHDDKTPYHCFDCDKRFKLKLTVAIHELSHRKNAKPAKKKRGPYGARDKFYECPLCTVKKKLKHEIHSHAVSDHQLEKSDIYTCEACKFMCFSEKDLQSHNVTTSHLTDRRSFCVICNQTFTNIYQHKAAVHSDARPFLCNQCGYSAKTKSSLRYHMVIHLETKDWSCSKCSYKSSSERRLKRHMKIHDPNKKHQCTKCSFATHDAYEFKRHFTKVHSRVKSYSCKFCPQTFMKHHEIRLHLMFEHECNDAFFCNFCDFTCATRANYKEHIQVHYGRNKHVCEICGFTGRYRTHYRRHMLTHTANKPFTCKICFKSVREASNLRRHMLTHSEDKPLACSVCGYRCKIRSRLMNHMKTHSELRPFACHLCKYTTKFNGNLMKHLENHARYKPHKCQYCSYACNERNKLRRHMNFRHKGLTEPKKEVGEGEKELVILPSQEQLLLVSKEELESIVSVDENGTVIAANNGAILVTADNVIDQEMADGTSERHIIISDQDGSVVSGLKDRTILATLEMEDKNMEVEALVTLKDVNNL